VVPGRGDGVVGLLPGEDAALVELDRLGDVPRDQVAEPAVVERPCEIAAHRDDAFELPRASGDLLVEAARRPLGDRLSLTAREALPLQPALEALDLIDRIAG
jgi:hypothetical protein